eukprot:GEMP01091072.1.p1 GENE.GEMP01091072.1~~GEMP01091072.1.p1  ORF type:complete len:244 (+),score=41.69 GEMP01091072.1:54-734(+)
MPTGLFAKFWGKSQPAQIVLLGDENAGKTALLYNLKLPRWSHSTMLDTLSKMRQIKEWSEEDGDATPVTLPDGKQVVIRDPGYHYEYFSRPFEYGLWDIPGNPALEGLWVSLSRSVQFHGVICVVDPSNKNLEWSRAVLHRAMYSSELRQAAFCILVNERKWIPYDQEANEVCYRLDLHNLDPALASRVKTHVLDVTSLRGELDERWVSILDGLRKVASKQGVNLG